MCKSTKGTQTASANRLPDIAPNSATGSGGGGGTPPPPANAFGGFQEHVPDAVYISTAGTAAFLQSANRFYSYFGLQPQNITSIENLVQILSNPANTTNYRRLLIVSHAHPRGMIIPFFTGGVNGTNKEVFRAFARSDLDGLKALTPFDPPLFDWDSVFSGAMTNIRGNAAHTAALTPFGLQTSGTPSGDLREFFRQCFDYVFVSTPGHVKNSSNGNISAAQRNIFARFVGEIANQVGKKIVGTTIAGTVINAGHISALKSMLTGLSLTNDLDADSTYVMSAYAADNMNYYPTLDNAARAVQDNFHQKIVQMRQRFTPTSAIDIRGCRAGDDPDYLTAMREFFDRPDDPRLTASAPRWFQSYPTLGTHKPTTRTDVTNFLSHRLFANTVAHDEQMTGARAWAELIKVAPLHTDFWSGLLNGTAAAFAALTWRSTVPPLFIPTPGITALAALNFSDLLSKVADLFNVPAASVPSAAQLTPLQSLLTSLPTYNQSLLPDTPDSTAPARLQQLFQGLKQMNTDLGQNVVPATAPSPLTAAQIRQYQQALLNFIETSRLTPIKNFMTAAKQSLETGDGIYYYMLFAGLPIFFFNKNAFTNHEGLMVLQAFEHDAMQSWFKCMWAEPLPANASNASTTATSTEENARRAPMLQDEHAATEWAICPAAEYGQHLQMSP